MRKGATHLLRAALHGRVRQLGQGRRDILAERLLERNDARAADTHSAFGRCRPRLSTTLAGLLWARGGEARQAARPLRLAAARQR
jgi:hypothetical protein